MITYEVAKKAAMKLQKSINGCREYLEAYYFYNTEYEGEGANGVLVLKEDGSMKPFPLFLLERKEDDRGKEIPF